MTHRRLVNLQRDCRFSIVFDSEAFPGLVKFHQNPALLAMAQTSRFDPVVSWETGSRLLRPSCAHQIAVPLPSAVGVYIPAPDGTERGTTLNARSTREAMFAAVRVFMSDWWRGPRPRIGMVHPDLTGLRWPRIP